MAIPIYTVLWYCVITNLLYILFAIGKRYVVLASYTNEVKDLQHAAIAISVEDSVHIMV